MPIALRIYWINYDGMRQLYAVAAPHQSHRQQTYVTHPWVLTDEHENCVAVFLPTREPRQVFVSGERAGAWPAPQSKADGADAAARSKAAEYLIREEIAGACESAGGKGEIADSAVIERDLTGDGKADLIISHEGITCANGGRSNACGAQVCTVMIYVRHGALLKLEREMLGAGVRVEGGAIPTIRMRAHGGRPAAIRWNGREFR
jgi:hypothetical protein